MPNFRAPWRDYLSVESLRAMDENDPISPATVLPLAEAEREIAERYVQKCEELRDAESTCANLRAMLQKAVPFLHVGVVFGDASSTRREIEQHLLMTQDDD